MKTARVSPSAHEELVYLADRVVPNRLAEKVVDLHALARKLGAYDVVYRARSVHGFTEWTPRGPRVVMGWGETEGRRRTLLAHECGHLIFDPVLKSEVLEEVSQLARKTLVGASMSWLAHRADSATAALGDLSLEAVCDDFAYELVFPDALAREWAAKVETIDSLARLRGLLKLSLPVALIKLNEFRSEQELPQLGVVRIRRSAGSYWMAASTAGLPPSWRGRVTLSRSSSRYVDTLSPGQRIVAHVELMNESRSVSVAAEVERYRDFATLMIEASQLVRTPGQSPRLSAR